MKVLLVELSMESAIVPGFNEFEEPIGLCYVGAAARRAGHEVRIIQQLLRSDEDVLAEVLHEHPQVLGFTAVTAVSTRVAEMARRTKRSIPNLVTVLGGSHACAVPEAAASEFDYVVIGEGEQTFVSLLSALAVGSKPDFPGICYRRDGETVNTGYPDRIRRLDDLFPMREGLSLTGYDPNGSPPVPHGTTGFAALVTSRGCSGYCSFCSNMSIWTDGSTGRVPVVLRSPEDVVAEVEYLRDEHGVNYIVFEDTDFLGRPRRQVLHLCDLLAHLTPSVRWACLARPDGILGSWPASAKNLREGIRLLEALSSAGCHLMCVGAESGDRSLRLSVGRDFENEQLLAVFDAIYSARIMAVAFLILGLPGETPASLARTRDMALQLKAIRLRASFFYPFEGTPCAEVARTGRVASRLASPECATTELPTVECGVPAQELTGFRDALLHEFYSGRSYQERLNEIAGWSDFWRETISEWRRRLPRQVPVMPKERPNVGLSAGPRSLSENPTSTKTVGTRC